MSEQLQTQCCIAGGGPAGMMLGLLLARAGVDVVVLEKHADFLRDFRGDTIHPSTLELIYELGLLDDFLSRPHHQARQIRGHISGKEVTVADFSRLRTHCKFIAFMPQWDFLDFVADHAREYPTFRLRMRAEVTGLLEEGGRIAGVRAMTPDGPLEVRAALTVGADGRRSKVRELAGLKVDDLGSPVDVLWMRLSRKPTDPAEQLMGWIDRGRILAMIYRGDYWQCAFVIVKASFNEIRQRGLEAIRKDIAETVPLLSDRVGELRDWDDLKLLTVMVDRLRQWYRPGLLCIGDAAHAMSPIGGIGINLAIQDAVAAANFLASPLRADKLSIRDLRKVQRRRMFPTRVIQGLQVTIQNRVFRAVLGAQRPLSVPLPFRLMQRFPLLRVIPAYIIGVGPRPEHVRTPDAFARQQSSRISS